MKMNSNKNPTTAAKRSMFAMFLNVGIMGGSIYMIAAELELAFNADENSQANYFYVVFYAVVAALMAFMLLVTYRRFFTCFMVGWNFSIFSRDGHHSPSSSSSPPGYDFGEGR